MPLNRGTQKQIAQRFKGNLDYFKKPHYWRSIRFWTILAVCLLGTAAMAWIYFSGNETIYSPGPLSAPHARLESDCSQCHDPAKRTLAGATMKLTNHHIDGRCDVCHRGHFFHAANVENARTCTTCHQEHRGSGAMASTGNSQCLHCHSDAPEMAASAKKGRRMSAAAFDIHPALGWDVFKTPRPPEGFTAVITSFEKDHPEFRLRADKLSDANTLKFNHRRHLLETNDIPLVNGKLMDCAFCHQPGPRGAFFQKVSF
ncbi:MAG TPA: hypothetical protein VK530_00240, partial [Candidatus Acidoferrum sp.]|nr:hypothetical protein [Candidatus Acidoferrum sp.]